MFHQNNYHRKTKFKTNTKSLLDKNYIIKSCNYGMVLLVHWMLSTVHLQCEK